MAKQSYFSSYFLSLLKILLFAQKLVDFNFDLLEILFVTVLLFAIYHSLLTSSELRAGYLQTLVQKFSRSLFCQSRQKLSLQVHYPARILTLKVKQISMVAT